jgi:hypothetical protein
MEGSFQPSTKTMTDTAGTAPKNIKGRGGTLPPPLVITAI